MAYSQDKPTETPQEPAAQEQPTETPQDPQPEVPETQPEPTVPAIEQPKEVKVEFAKVLPSYFLLHLKGGASPNGDSQASSAFSNITFSLKEMLRGDLFAAYRSSSFLDENDIRTVINVPFITKLDLHSRYEGIGLKLGFRGSLEETIRRNSDFSSNVIGTSIVEVATRTKTVDVLEHYGGLFELDYEGVTISLRPFHLLFPTINEHEITQRVIDPNPSASYENNFIFRDPTARKTKSGMLFRAGHTKELKEKYSLVTDLVGILEQENLEFPGAEKREIQRIHVGIDAFLDMPVIAPRIAIYRGFLDDKIRGERNAHSENSTKFLASLYFDAKSITLKETVIASDDPKIDKITKKVNLPILFGATYIHDRQYGASDRYARKSCSAVFGIGNASGREALNSLASLEEDLALKLLGLRPEEGSVLSKAHSIWQAYQRPFKIAAKDTYGLLLTGRCTQERLNSKNNLLYEGQGYALLDSLLLNAGIQHNKDTRERSWNVGIGYFAKDWFFLGADYTETKENNERTGTYSAGARISIR